jgi:hypothetical protein
MKALEALKKVTISHEMMAYNYNYYLDRGDEGYQICINPNWEGELYLIKQSLTKQEEMKAKVELLLRKLPNIRGYKAEIDRNLDLSITIDKLKEMVGVK